MSTRLSSLAWVPLACVLLATVELRAAPPQATVVERGQAKMAVVVAPDASPRLRQAAADLVDMLQRISGARLEIQTGGGERGLVVGLPQSFDKLPFPVAFEPGPALPETYLLRSTADGLYLLGASELAVEHAVWDLLYRLGYRHYFPGATWEVVPRLDDVRLAIDTVQRPDYLYRRIFFGYGGFMRQGGIERLAQWCVRNRMTSDDSRASVPLVVGHSYAGFADAHEKILAEHPEYLALVGGQRKRNKVSQKFCTSNPALRKLMVDHAIAYMEKYPKAMSLSRDPSDLGNWCQCDECAKIGSPSNQAVLIANETAQALQERFGTRYVTLQAYAFHSPPPTIDVHPNVIVAVATSFIRGGLSIDELIAGWTARGATVGLREYYSVFAWHHDLPCGARGMRPSYLASSITRFHERGARYMTAESCENFGPNGVGYFLASRMLWDTDEAGQWQQTFQEFLTLSFGPAREPMAKFYGLILDKPGVRISEDLLARLYRALGEAYALAADRPDVRARLNDLALYVRYIEVYRQYQQSRGGGDGEDEAEASAAGTGSLSRQEAYEALLRYTWRIGTTGMVDTIAVWRDVTRREKVAKLPPEAALSVREPKNPWKSSQPFSDDEIRQMVEQGVANHQPFDFEAMSFSDDLVPARQLGPGAAKIHEALAKKPTLAGATPIGGGLRGRVTYHLWLDQPGSITFEATSGLLYKDRGNLSLQLFDPADDENPLSADESTPPDGQTRRVTLTSPRAGLHKLVVDNGGDRSNIGWPNGVPVGTTSPQGVGRWQLFFYVPRGTKEIVAFIRHTEGQFLAPDGSVALDLTKVKPSSYVRVAVPSGQDGQLWKMHFMIGSPELLNVPPYLGRSLNEMLLPREVVEADRKP